MSYEQAASMAGGLSPSTATVQPGAFVYTSDNKQLGKVREWRDEAFKVDAALQPDYWLPLTAVATATPDKVLLTFPKDQLGGMKIDM
jgi:hypothetical protein